jgi:hypothetical protein
MDYETHGSDGHGGVPLVLVHGALSGIGTSFGQMLPGLASARRVSSATSPACRAPGSRSSRAAPTSPSSTAASGWLR